MPLPIKGRDGASGQFRKAARRKSPSSSASLRLKADYENGHGPPTEVLSIFSKTSRLLRRAVQILGQRTDQMIEDAGRHVRCQRAAALVDAVDPQAERRRVDVPAEQTAYTRLDLRLEIGATRTVERDRRLYCLISASVSNSKLLGRASPTILRGKTGKLRATENTVCRGLRLSTQGFKPRLFRTEIRALRKCLTKADEMQQKRCHCRLQERSVAAISPRSGHGV